jgi:hypothetical protein
LGERDPVCLVPCDREISQQGGKISLIRRNDLDEDGIRREFIHGQFACFMKSLAKRHNAAFIRRKRNPTRSIGLEKLREIGDGNSFLSGLLLLHLIFSLSARRILSRPRGPGSAIALNKSTVAHYLFLTRKARMARKDAFTTLGNPDRSTPGIFSDILLH